jgi:hypothetical protein
MTPLLNVASWLLVLLMGAGGDEKNADPVEIDFAPLPAARSIDYALYYDFHSSGDVGFGGVTHVTKESPSELRNELKADLEKAGWKVKSEGETKLVVYGHKTNSVQKAVFRVDTFEHKVKGDVTPTVKRVKKA